ncbi:MAG: PP2C family protein-serine/threonine phosphatase [Spirochaetes bacterium]|jgi:sigma-B regulation protein RsbU (phosphoserine phosphatase)|nr:PP2C family protein-serine/threonine phosphatase [Spirochaetota bacterium]
MTRCLVNAALLAGLALLNAFFFMEAREFALHGRSLAGPAGAAFTGLDRGAESLWFFLFLIACADIQFVWAFIIRVIHPYRRLARLFVWFGFALCLYCFSLVDLFSRAAFVPAHVLTGILLGYAGVVIGFNLTNKKTSPAAAAVSLVPGTGIFLASIAFPSGAGGAFALKLLAIYLILCSLFAIGSLALSTMGAGNSYLLRRNVTIMACMAFGFLAPILFFALRLFAGIQVPPALGPGLMLIVPLCVGNRLLENNFFNVAPYIGKGALAIILNVAIAAAGGGGLYYILSISAFSGEMLIDAALFATGMILLLKAKFSASDWLRDALGAGRDRYAESLQTIAELVSSPAELPAKLGKIFAEVVAVAGTPPPRLILFEDRPGGFQAELVRYAEPLSRESSLFRFLSESPATMLCYTLIRNDAVEESVYSFMKERDVLIAVPLIRDGEIRGALMVGDKAGDEFFSDEEVGYLQTVSMQLYQLIENDRLFNDYIMQRSFERELDIASSIQQRLFPERAPEKRGLSIHYFNRPYIKVTGDYYDFITIDRNRTALVIADVSGHGLSAAMILSMTSSIISAMLMEKKTIDKAVEEVNHFLTRRYNGVDLITLFVGVYDKSTRELVYINAGHCAPVLIRSGRKDLSTLEGRSKILGADPEANYSSSRFALGRGDELILYTDGLVELYDERTEEQFCESRLLEAVSRARDAEIEEKIRIIRAKAESFGEAIHDDITVIGIKIL